LRGEADSDLAQDRHRLGVKRAGIGAGAVDDDARRADGARQAFGDLAAGGVGDAQEPHPASPRPGARAHAPEASAQLVGPAALAKLGAAMHRKPLLDLLERVLERTPEDRARARSFQRFVRSHADCFERSCAEGHVTASAFVVSADGRRFLLLHHKKLGRWLQPGGHADGESDPLAVALREAREETGLAPLPLDVDVHAIPARAGEPAHHHFDVRFLLVAEAEETARANDECDALRWIDLRDLERFVEEESLLRMGRRARRLLAAADAADRRATT
jgi:8-oxo-dGTP pyrophosphatase MutT (NUDIX family)